jgi:hypothetical protein
VLLLGLGLLLAVVGLVAGDGPELLLLGLALGEGLLLGLEVLLFGLGPGVRLALLVGVAELL